ncbi:Lrp/AsnC family transcriptional regulator [Nocardia cerradoensis]|uniref:Lrp/AsnC family transcriptional regulator n=1 Tax=Nocardia cerradoensis TaxID=85688 RepID=UPI00167AE8FC|nr:Lrp/AsnC family transcriptional regulator [Nocardia cerradoensis]
MSADTVLAWPPSADRSVAAALGVSAATPPPAPLDSLDSALLDLLAVDGRMTNRELAAATGASSATVGSRIRRLVADRVLIFTALFDWERAGFGWFVVATITVEGRSVREVANEVAALGECVGLATVLGSADLLGYFLVADRAELRRLSTERLGDVRGIGTVRMDLATDSTVTGLGRRFFLVRGEPLIRLPEPVIELDDLDTRIVAELLCDGRRSNRHIARKLDVSEGAVRTRLHRMTDSGLFCIEAMIEPTALGLVGALATVRIRADRNRVDRIAEAASRIAGVLLVASVVGDAEMVVAIGAADQFQLLAVIREGIRMLDGVRSVETHQMVEIVKFTPYFKRLDR